MRLTAGSLLIALASYAAALPSGPEDISQVTALGKRDDVPTANAIVWAGGQCKGAKQSLWNFRTTSNTPGQRNTCYTPQNNAWSNSFQVHGWGCHTWLHTSSDCSDGNPYFVTSSDCLTRGFGSVQYSCPIQTVISG